MDNLTLASILVLAIIAVVYYDVRRQRKNTSEPLKYTFNFDDHINSLAKAEIKEDKPIIITNEDFMLKGPEFTDLWNMYCLLSEKERTASIQRANYHLDHELFHKHTGEIIALRSMIKTVEKLIKSKINEIH